MKRLLVLATIAVFMVVGVAGLASAAVTVAQATQKGSLLVFPKIDTRANFDTAGGADIAYDRDAYVAIGNDSANDVTLECIWSYPRIDFLEYDNLKEKRVERAYQQVCCGVEDFTIRLTPFQVVYFSAGTGFANLLGDDLFDSINKIPSAAKGIASLYCFAVNNANDKKPISFNHLYGEVTNVRWELSGGIATNGVSSWAYNAYAFRANKSIGNAMAAFDATSEGYTLPLTGKAGGYDACPDKLTFNFIAKQTLSLNSLDPAQLGTDITLIPCTQDLREFTKAADPFKPTKTLAVFDIFNANEDHFSGTMACVKCFFEQVLGVTSKGAQYYDPQPPNGTGTGWNDINRTPDILDAFQFIKGDNFLFLPPHGGIGTLFGRAKVDATDGSCNVGTLDTALPTQKTALLGVVYDFMDVFSVNGILSPDTIPESSSGRSMTGVGAQTGQIRYSR